MRECESEIQNLKRKVNKNVMVVNGNYLNCIEGEKSGCGI